VRSAARAALAVIAAARIAAADPEADADAAFRAAEQRAATGDPTAIDAFERLGATQPATRWTDDAWAEAARLAERAGDRSRARRDLAQAIATAGDDAVRRRATADLARLDAIAGPGGQWAAVATEHDRLADRLAAGGDPFRQAATDSRRCTRYERRGRRATRSHVPSVSFRPSRKRRRRRNNSGYFGMKSCHTSPDPL
jgi:hypothetical protein